MNKLDIFKYLAGAALPVLAFLGKQFLLPKEKQEEFATSLRNELREMVRERDGKISDLEKRVNTLTFRNFKLVQILVEKGIDIPDYLINDPDMPTK